MAVEGVVQMFNRDLLRSYNKTADRKVGGFVWVEDLELAPGCLTVKHGANRRAKGRLV